MSIFDSTKFQKLFFLGPSGSYTDVAKNKFIKHFNLNCDIESCESIYQVMKMLNVNEHSVAVVPIENSVEGIVRETQDSIYRIADDGFGIIAECTLNVEHSLVGFARDKSEINTIISHPQALAQCRNYIDSNFLDNVRKVPELSTSMAVSKLSKEEKGVVAIASEYCANLLNVPIIEKGINDEKNNTTRFVMIAKAKASKTERNKVSIAFSTENQSGALNKVLSVFEKYNINMSYIDSRPSKKELGEYIFYVSVNGYPTACENV